MQRPDSHSEYSCEIQPPAVAESASGRHRDVAASRRGRHGVLYKCRIRVNISSRCLRSGHRISLRRRGPFQRSGVCIPERPSNPGKQHSCVGKCNKSTRNKLKSRYHHLCLPVALTIGASAAASSSLPFQRRLRRTSQGFVGHLVSYHAGHNLISPRRGANINTGKLPSARIKFTAKCEPKLLAQQQGSKLSNCC